MATNNVTPRTVELQLTRGQVAIITDIDSDLTGFKWCADYHADTDSFYAVRSTWLGNGKSKTERLHRIILSRMLGRTLVRGEQVDHINQQTLDNRRSNLRLATNAQNQQNQSLSKNNKSGYKGVYRNPKGRWIAQIRENGKSRYLGSFVSPLEAAHAYDTAALRLFGEFAFLNFPLAT